MAFVTFLIIIISITKVCMNYAKDCERRRDMTEELNTFNRFAMRYVKVYTLGECVRACRTEPQCGTFLFTREYRECFLLRENNATFVDTLKGWFLSDFRNWNVGPCSDHTCAEDENCYTAGTNYVCKKVYDVCFKHLPEKMCFKHVVIVDYSGWPNLGNSTLVRNVMECVTFCSLRHPTFTSLAYVANTSKCTCKKATITNLYNIPLGDLYMPSEKIDMYFRIK